MRPSDTKTFDLIVDGKYAEVKSSKGPYAKLGFIGLTDNQFEAVKNGVEFSVFIVCNLGDPANLEVREIPSDAFARISPKIECTYYWYRPQLDSMGA